MANKNPVKSNPKPQQAPAPRPTPSQGQPVQKGGKK
jgi:hypothetical protein